MSVSAGGLAALMYTDTVQTFVIVAGACALTGFCECMLYLFKTPRFIKEVPPQQDGSLTRVSHC